MSGAPRVLLATLSVRTSARGRPYLSGFLGKARVVAFEGEPDRWGNATWDIFVAEPEPRDASAAGASQAPTREAASGRASNPPAAGAASRASGDRYRSPRPEGARARQERVAGEIAAEHGAQGDRPFDDAVPF